MIQSMTGYGKANGSSENFTFEVEVKSVNNRFLDIYVRIPKDLYSYEIEYRNIIKNSISRGKVSLSINITQDAMEPNIAEIDNDNLSKIISGLNKIKKEANIEEDVKLSHLLSFSNLFSENNSELKEADIEAVKAVLSQAIIKMKEMRATEGQTLKIDLLERLKNIEISAKNISSLAKNSVEEYFLKLKERAAELLNGVSEGDERLSLELALLSEKFDITEEIVRLDSHIDQFRNTLEKDDDAGKKLNFIVQEMNREANTMGNKSVSLEITNNTIAIKEELEKIREQIQNIE